MTQHTLTTCSLLLPFNGVSISARSMTAASPMQQQHLAQIIDEIAAKRWGMLNNCGGVHEEGEQTESSSSTERSVGGALNRKHTTTNLLQSASTSITASALKEV